MGRWGGRDSPHIVRDVFNENDHPRDHGKFTSGAGSAGGAHHEVLKKTEDDPEAFSKALGDVSKLSHEEVNEIAHKYTKGRQKWPTKKAAIEAIKGEQVYRMYQNAKMNQVKKTGYFGAGP